MRRYMLFAAALFGASAGVATAGTGVGHAAELAAPSCSQALDCGGDSCCTRLPVPGGTFSYGRDGSLERNDVAVAPFRLDKYEATVGRFRSWVKAGAPLPKEGTFLQKDLDGSAIVWSRTAQLSVQRPERLSGWEKYDTWTLSQASAPKNNINWYTAAAFCHWDGGRLPTEIEWNYVAVGGDEQRRFPWGDGYPTFEHAVYNCQGDGNGSCSVADLLPVGSKPKGAGRWGHMDLAGSLFEWTVAHQGATQKNTTARSRGGGFCYIGGDDRRAPLGLQAKTARLDDLSTLSHTVGVRCAYD